MKLFIIAIIAITNIMGFAQARLGETLEQCKVRYGKPTDQNGALHTFVSGNFIIVMQFHPVTGKAMLVSYMKQGEDDEAEFTAAQIRELVRINTNTTIDQWERRKDQETEDTVAMSSGEYIMVCGVGKRKYVFLSTTEGMRISGKMIEQKEVSELKGL